MASEAKKKTKKPTNGQVNGNAAIGKSGVAQAASASTTNGQQNQSGILNFATRKQQSFRQNFKETKSMNNNNNARNSSSMNNVGGGGGGGKGGLENVDFNEALDAVVYGEEITKFSKNGKKKHVSFFYVLESDSNMLQWFSASKKFMDSRIKITEIKQMYSLPRVTEEAAKVVNSSLCLCLLVEGGREFVLEFDTRKQRDLWWKGLSILKEFGKQFDSNNTISKEQWVEAMLLGSDFDKKKRIPEKDVKKLLRKLLISIQAEELDARMKPYLPKINSTAGPSAGSITAAAAAAAANPSNSSASTIDKSITFSDFISLAISLMEKPELLAMYNSYCENGYMLGWKDVQRFFLKEQHEDIDEKVVLQKINRFSKGKETKMMNFLGFCHTLITAENSIFDPAKLLPNFDKPLTDYYIHSSFHSFLAHDMAANNQKDQAKGYAFLLQKGVRHFEIVCKDNDVSGGEPLVMQGMFQNITVSFSEVIRVIKQYGFERNQTPIILNIEHDCSISSQERIAAILVNFLGNEILYRLPENFISFEFLPSLNELKKRVLIRTRGRLANIISKYEKKIAKMVAEREERERFQQEQQERQLEIKRQQLREKERKKLLNQNQNSDDEENSYDDRNKRGNNNQKYNNNKNQKKNKNNNNYYNENDDDEEEEDGSYYYSDEDDYQRKKAQKKTTSSHNNNNNNRTPDKKQSNGNAGKNSNGKQQGDKTKPIQPQITLKNNANMKSMTSVMSGQNNNGVSAHANSKGGAKKESEIELLIDLEMNLDKEFINDDNYAIGKTTQINSFQIQSNKAFVTVNREIKSMVSQQQNSQYSLAENSKEAMQRRLRSDQQPQQAFFEAKSPSLKSQHSNKPHQKRLSIRTSSFKQLQHLEIGFKSDVPLHEYHGSQTNVNVAGATAGGQASNMNNTNNNNNASREENGVDSPRQYKPNQSEKKRHSLLYVARKRASAENIQFGSILNTQANDQHSMRDVLANGSLYAAEGKKALDGIGLDSVEQYELQSEENFMENSKSGIGGIGDDVLLLQQNGLYGSGQQIELVPRMPSAVLMTQHNSSNMAKLKKSEMGQYKAGVSNQLEEITALFACKLSSQSDLSIWSFSQISEHKISQAMNTAMIMHPQTNQQSSQQQQQSATFAMSEENKLMHAITTHTRKFLTRVLPKHLRYDDGNCNFIQSMCAGCQSVPINYISSDLQLLMYTQLFKQNGGCGYIPKPSWLLSSAPPVTSAYYEKDAQKPRMWLKIELISGQSLRNQNDEEKKITPIVSIRLVGSAIDNVMNETTFSSEGCQTSKEGMNFNPQFDNCIADFMVHIPELSFLVFQVFDGPGIAGKIAQYALPVSCIRKGFRTVPLVDAQLNAIPNSFLFVHVAIEVLTQQQQMQLLSKQTKQGRTFIDQMQTDEVLNNI